MKVACVHQIQHVHACVWLVHRAYGSCKCSKPIFNFIFLAQRWVNEIPLLPSKNISPNFPINLPCGHMKKKRKRKKTTQVMLGPNWVVVFKGLGLPLCLVLEAYDDIFILAGPVCFGLVKIGPKTV